MGCGPSKEANVVSPSMTNVKVNGKNENGKPSVDPVNSAVATSKPTTDASHVIQPGFSMGFSSSKEDNVISSSTTKVKVDGKNENGKPSVDPVNSAVATAKPTIDASHVIQPGFSMGFSSSKEDNVIPSSTTKVKVNGKRENGKPSVDPVNSSVATAKPTTDESHVKQTVFSTGFGPSKEDNVVSPSTTKVKVNGKNENGKPSVDPVNSAVATAKPTKDASHVKQTVDAIKASLDPDEDSVVRVLDAFSYDKIDMHARKAPKTLRSSPRELVAYLSKPYSEPKMIVRAIFVWITDNIAYDTDGYFGKCEKASCDAEDVMRGGKSVCSGYANVMERLCREAGIPVKKLSGYAKGYGSSVEKPFSINEKTNHAWNAVELGGKWFLLDSTWGSGHLGENAAFEKKFKEFYYLSELRNFANSHFPYMNGDMEGSVEWQLLEQPVTLEDFNKLLRIKPEAFKLGVWPVSHKEGLVRMKHEVKMSFKCDRQHEVQYTASLRHKQGNMLCTMQGNVFNQIENGLFTTRIRPHTTGTFQLKVCGRKASDDGSFHQLFKYVIKCEEATIEHFSYPYSYTQAQTDRCILVEPLQGKLNQNSVVNFHITSPYLNRIMINNASNKTFLEKSGSSFKGTIKVGSKEANLSVYGSRETSGGLNGIYKFEIV